MKQIMLLILLCGALTVTIAFAQKSSEPTQGIESAVVEITDKLQIQDKILLGSYIFEHDDARMAKGQPCMHIYLNNKGKPGELVTAFHCTPVAREVTKVLVINVAMTADPNIWKLKEIQFVGSTKGHLVP